MTATRTDWPLVRRTRAKLAEVFSADLRSLAVYRIVLALLALADVVIRATDLKAHYTDGGVLPRAFLIEAIPRQWSFSLHMMSGDGFTQAVLLLITGLAALALLVGLRTRLMTILIWVLLVSVHMRNPMVLNSGDVLFRLLFFWGMFLPLGACWSVDRTSMASPPALSMRFFSFATIGLFAQLAFVYVFTALLKDGREWRVDGTAIYYALSVDQFTTPLGTILYQFPTIMWLLTFAVIWFEAIGAFLLFSPIFTGPVRTAAVLGFMGLHLGIGLTMSIGAFPLISSLSIVCFLPAWFWDKVAAWIWAVLANRRGDGRRLQRRVADLIQTYLSPFGARSLPALATQPTLFWGQAGHGAHARSWNGPARSFVRWQSALRRVTPVISIRAGAAPSRAAVEAPPTGWPLTLRSSVWTNLAAAFFVAYIFGWNLSTVSDFRMPDFLYPIGSYLRLDQSWSMFAPYPLKDDGWYVIPGTLRDRTELDLLPVLSGDFSIHEGVDWEKPPLVYRTYKNDRWRKYMMNLWARKHEGHRLYLGRYICREWNARHDGAEVLERFQIYYMLETTLPDYRHAEPEKVVTWKHRCF